MEQVFGKTLKLSTGRRVPTRFVGEQHVLEDLGWIPTVADWLRCIKPARWMGKTINLEAKLAARKRQPAAPSRHRRAGKLKRRGTTA